MRVLVNIRKSMLSDSKYTDVGFKTETNNRFEISTFKTEYMRNFAKIRKFIFFGPKCPDFGIWDQNY